MASTGKFGRDSRFWRKFTLLNLLYSALGLGAENTVKVLITGASGRIGRAIYAELMKSYKVVGVDRVPSSTADYVGDIRDPLFVGKALTGVDVVVHAAALHAPHVGLFSDVEFESINVRASEELVLLAIKSGVKHVVFTSTTALYGHASTPAGMAGWIDETVKPRPKTIYHRTKIDAERSFQHLSSQFDFPITVLQVSRCFPEPADLMAVYRYSRGIDARDVATAHRCAIEKRLAGFNRFIVSGATPFDPSCCEQLFTSAPTLLAKYLPDLVYAFEERGWPLPKSLDRVYDSSAAQQGLNWRPEFHADSVLESLDNGLEDVLPEQAAGEQA